MKPSVFVVTAVSSLVGGSITFAILLWLGKGNPFFAIVAGATLGTLWAAVMHHRSPGATNSRGVKISIGAVLAISMVVLGVALHLIFAPFFHVPITLFNSAVGSFIYPFFVFDPIWRTVSKWKAAWKAASQELGER